MNKNNGETEEPAVNITACVGRVRENKREEGANITVAAQMKGENERVRVCLTVYGNICCKGTC